MARRKTPHRPCPCGEGDNFSQCCEPLLLNKLIATDACALMRSRYSAYVLRDEAYLLSTWHPSTRPARLGLDKEPANQWIGLDIIDHDDTHVEFIARYKLGGRAYRLHERSRFRQENGVWYYIDGEMFNA